MRLVSFQRYRRRALGALHGSGEVVDLCAAAAAYLCLAEQDPCGEAEAELRIPAEVAAFLSGGEISRTLARKALAFALERGAAGGIGGEPLILPVSSVRLRAPVAAPLIIGTGATFVQRLDQPAGDRTDHTEFYLRNPLQALGPGEEIPFQPWVTDQLQAQAGVGVVVGHQIRCATVAEAEAAIYGYCAVTDLAAENLHTLSWAGPLFHIQYAQGKTFDGSLVLGPIVARGEAGRLPVARLLVDGRPAGERNLAELAGAAPSWISYISEFVTLQPGSIILIGSSDSTRAGELAGAGARLSVQQPALPAGVSLGPGSTLTVEAEGLGRLENRIGQRAPTDFAGGR